MVNESAFRRYQIYLSGLCCQCAALAVLKEKMQDGEVVTESEMAYTCGSLEYSKKRFLDAKTELGFTDGLSFLEDNNFAGFRIKDGVVIGSYDNLIKVAEPWYNQFCNGEGNNYRYEVANYLFAFQYKQDGDLPMPQEERRPIRKRKIVGHRPKIVFFKSLRRAS